jgi:hypothetical protein
MISVPTAAKSRVGRASLVQKCLFDTAVDQMTTDGIVSGR